MTYVITDYTDIKRIIVSSPNLPVKTYKNIRGIFDAGYTEGAEAFMKFIVRALRDQTYNELFNAVYILMQANPQRSVNLLFQATQHQLDNRQFISHLVNMADLNGINRYSLHGVIKAYKDNDFNVFLHYYRDFSTQHRQQLQDYLDIPVSFWFRIRLAI